MPTSLTESYTESLLSLARESGLRRALHGVPPTKARQLLGEFVEQLMRDGGPDFHYVVNVSHTKRDHPYMSVWRPDNKGYAYPVSWAGR